MDKILEFLTKDFNLIGITMSVWIWLLIALILIAAIVVIIVVCCRAGKKRKEKRLAEIQLQAEKDVPDGLPVNEVSAIPEQQSEAAREEEPKQSAASKNQKATTASKSEQKQSKSAQKEIKPAQKDSKPEVAAKSDVEVDEVVDDAPDSNDEVDESLDEKPVTQPKVYHISLREDGKWQVKLGKGEKALKLFDTQAEAITFAKEKAKNQGGHITIHKVDGKIRKQKY